MTLRSRPTYACHDRRYRFGGRRCEAGVSLAITLIYLILISIVGISTMRIAMLEQRMARNTSDRQIALAAAEHGMHQAELSIRSVGAIPDFFGDQSANRTVGYLNPQYDASPYTHLRLDGFKVYPGIVLDNMASVFNSNCLKGLCNASSPWLSLTTHLGASTTASPRFFGMPTTAQLTGVNQPLYFIEYLPNMSEIRTSFMGFYELPQLKDNEAISYRDNQMYLPGNTPGYDMIDSAFVGAANMIPANADFGLVKACWDTFGYWNIPGQSLTYNACYLRGGPHSVDTEGEAIDYRQLQKGMYALRVSDANFESSYFMEGPTDTRGWKPPARGTPLAPAPQLTKAAQGQVYLTPDPDCLFTSSAGDQVLGLPSCGDGVIAVTSPTFPLLFLRPNYRYRSYYRVTVVGWGLNSRTRVVTQQVFYREIYQWNSVTKTEATSAVSNMNQALPSCGHKNRATEAGLSCQNGSIANPAKFYGYAYPPSNINGTRTRMVPGHAKAFFWNGSKTATADNRCSHWLGKEDLRWRMPSNAPANTPFVWVNPDAFTMSPTTVVYSVE